LPFVDLDVEIEKSEGQPINQIFEKKKEDYFRQVESSILNKFCSSAESFIMSTGGGAPCFHDNMTMMIILEKQFFLMFQQKRLQPA